MPERSNTFLRIRGSSAAPTIGTAVSNGCARPANERTVDLHARGPLDTRVLLYPQGVALSG